MPPKLRAVGGKGAKAKKGGKKGGKKGKPKKPPKKYAQLMFEGEYIWNKKRGELEVIAGTLQAQVEVERGERIRMMYERDWLYEMSKISLQRIRAIRKKNELSFVQTNRAVQDLEERKLITGLTKKQAEYGMLMRTGAIEMRDHKRMSRLRRLIPLSWEMMVDANALADELIAGLPKEREERMKKKWESLEPLEERLGQLKEDSSRILKLFHKINMKQLDETLCVYKTELIRDYDEVGRMLAWSHSKHMFFITLFRHFALDMLHNELTVIMLFLDHCDEMDADMAWKEPHGELYEKGLVVLTNKIQQVQEEFIKQKIHVIEYGRRAHGLFITYKSLRLTEIRLKLALDQHQIILDETKDVEFLRELHYEGCSFIY